MSVGSLFIRTMSAESMAMSLPLATAQPISASLRAGASLMPSPTIITVPYFLRISPTISAFCSGNTSEYISSAPKLLPIYSAHALLSPERITVLTPNFRSLSNASGEVSLSLSATAITPTAILSTAVKISDLPSTERRFASLSYSEVSAPFSLRNAALPSRISLPSSRALMPLPEIFWVLSGLRAVLNPFSAAYSVTAFASGWSESASTAAAVSSKSFLLSETTSVTVGFPTVTVPVLSKITVFTL